MYGINWEGPILDHEDEVDWVTLPDCRCPLSVEDYDDLEHAISPTVVSSNYGMDLYLTVVRFVEDKLSDYQRYTDDYNWHCVTILSQNSQVKGHEAFAMSAVMTRYTKFQLS